jgi:DNA-binding GntR family transcriptional regulator
VRRALAVLARYGLIRSTRGRGTFVLPPGERGT